MAKDYPAGGATPSALRTREASPLHNYFLLRAFDRPPPSPGLLPSDSRIVAEAVPIS